jgi:uncharacterized membrane protein
MALWQLAILASLVPIVIAGLLLLRLPRIARRGLFFGAYVGAAWVPDERARTIERSWRRGMLACIAATVVVGMLFALAPGSRLSFRSGQIVFLTALLTCLLVLFGGATACIMRACRAAQGLAVPQSPPPGAASLVPTSRRTLLPALALGFCLLVGLACLAYGWACYDHLPERWVLHRNVMGEPDHWIRRSPVTVMGPPMMALCLPSWFAACGWLISSAKRGLRLGDDRGISARAQDRFRIAQARLFAGLSILFSVELAVCSLGFIDKGLGRCLVPPVAAGIAVWSIPVYLLAGVVYIGVRIGQGGSKLETPVAGMPLANGLADNTKWKLGSYFNPSDPSLFVEDRFGLWFTPNWGNPKAAAFFGGGIALLLALIVGFCVAVFAE